MGTAATAYEWVEKRYGREVIVVPLMVPDFIIEHYLGYVSGVMGGNFWIMCKTKQALKQAGEKALAAIHLVEGVVTPFDVCSAGSKPETHFPKIGPTTNHLYCPSLKKRLGKESRVPEGVGYIAEIVYDGISLQAVKQATKAGIEAVLDIDGVVKVSAGNYGGKLGEYKIPVNGVVFMTKFDVVGFGALNVDVLFKVDRLAKAEEESFVEDYTEACGGSAANTIVALARLGCKTGFIGKVADDREGKLQIDCFNK